MKSLALLLVLAILAASVLAVSVDVNVNVGGHNGRHRGHHGKHHESPENVNEDLPTVGAGGDCGPYANSERFNLAKNGGAKIEVTKVAREHLSDPSIFSASPTAKDNSIAIPTACAFNKMFNAAKAAGVRITINSAFRTLERQKYFWNCYQTRRCNNGNLAAQPGSSNHGLGIALDLNAGSKGTPQYRWLATNGQKFGFVRTVSSETWHWEHRPGTPKASYT
jgi:hypothetical protein